jgi:ABC-type glycerol-3-phosphate transport system substrate-binding protein
MKMRVFALAGVAALALAACSGNNQDEVNNADLNQPSAEQLNELSTGAANDAASEAAALGNQQAQLNSENAAAEDNVTNPDDAQEQNVSGM